jgi:hypothetical protein
MFGFRLAEIIGWLALTFAAGLVVYASRASLDGARSTLSQWMGVFRRKGSPVATWHPSFDRLARYGALGIWEIGTLLLALNYLFDQRVIVRYEAGPLLPATGPQLPDQMFHFNAYLTNRGALNDIQWRGGASLTWQPMRAFMANINFDNIYRSFSSKPDGLSGGGIQRNYITSWFTAGGPYFSQSDIDSFVAGRDNMYLMLVIRQKPPWSKQWTYTESCVELKASGETLLCANGHNRTFAESEIHSDCSSKFPPLITSLDQVLASDPKTVATSDGLMLSTEEIRELFHKYFPVEKCKIEDVVAIARTSRFFVKSFQGREDYIIEFSNDGVSSRPGYLVQIAIDPKTGDFARPIVRPNRYARPDPKGGEAIP